ADQPGHCAHSALTPESRIAVSAGIWPTQAITTFVAHHHVSEVPFGLALPCGSTQRIAVAPPSGIVSATVSVGQEALVASGHGAYTGSSHLDLLTGGAG